jgi:hypothetical protein
LLSGILDLALSDRYEATIVVGNQYVVVTAEAAAAHRITLESAEVEVTGAAGRSVASSVVPTVAVVGPAHSTEPGWAVAALRLLDQASVVPDEDALNGFAFQSGSVAAV